ncbi:hypothetical protein XH99_31850 [Bradyrhizobium nanningense]|uniref:Uncharacterized protein n=1 Tax=Bradyrhizobium nanningense TaxID=1325118 RepID=A0A4Q0RXD4_9BRAD|nr:hypothetical protein [Bradyrhizobium nanningense]RXH23308.1 hypothetical protein XH99_31850 [Bradyrhizobium nanningense]RXH27591.1 hypothetical protein XH84_29785 [Bradyrhizobium nanningense]
MSNIELTQIVLDFESALLNGVRSGADEVGLTKIRDEAFDRVLAVEGPSPPPLETIFDVAGEMGRKLSMALKAIKS